MAKLRRVLKQRLLLSWANPFSRKASRARALKNLFQLRKPK
jgi:hypothetical protein